MFAADNMILEKIFELKSKQVLFAWFFSHSQTTEYGSITKWQQDL